MDISPVGYLILAAFIACLVVGVINWGYAAYFMFKTMSGYHPKREWGRFVPISIFSPWFFTEEGNRHRLKMLRHTAFFLVCVAVSAAIGFSLEVLSMQSATR
jgi:hypothetical protein